MSQILAVFDGVQESIKGLNNAQKLAADLDLELKVLAIVATPSGVMVNKEGRAVEDGEVDLNEYNQIAQNYYDLLKEKGINRFEIVLGNPQAILIAEAAKEEIQAVFQETHEEANGAFFLTDTFTEKVTKLVDVPVLTYKCDRSKQAIKKIVIASSFDSVNEKDLSWLNTVVAKLGVEVHFLRVNTLKSFHSEDEVIKRMAVYAENNGVKNPVFAVKEAKDIDYGIMEYAAENEMDWVAIETKARTGFSKVFKGCLSAEVVSGLMMPVLTFKSK